MIVSRRWLESLLPDRALDARDAAERLSARCAPVDAVVPLHQDLGDVVIGRVLDVRRHPNADRLSLCSVDAGSGEPLEVVCGAPNVEAGKRYPFAPVGATLPGGLRLERRKIRGVESNGMLCSAKELGLGADQAGILELETDAAPGTPFLDAIPVGDEQIVIDVPANRPDLLGHRGVARELGASLGATVKLPEVARRLDRWTVGPSTRPTVQQTNAVVDGVHVRLEDPEGAPRYMIAVIRGVRVGPSPAWLAHRLQSIGQRSINNVVDATNYILFEINQPLHAFDLAQLRGPAVVVRRAKTSEPIVTLDAVSRRLTADMTVICDAERPQIIAGVMGSAESEVSAGTTDIVLECAYFQPTRIRRTRRALGVSSESSYRFERGIDMLAMPDALARAIDLIRAVAGGELREPPIDLWPEPQQPGGSGGVGGRTVFLREARVAHVLGVAIPRDEIERLLGSIGFVAAPRDGRLAVQVPSWRGDVQREVDLIEEVARLRGYDSFPADLGAYRPGTVPDAPSEIALARIRERLARAGLYEARTLPLGPPDSPDAVAILNPLSAGEAHLRSRMLPGLVRRVEHNWSVGQRDIRLFEVGTVFRTVGPLDRGNVKPANGPTVQRSHLPDEQLWLGGVITGARHPGHWSSASKVPDMDIWDLKSHFELAVETAVPGAGATVRPAAAGGFEAVDGSGTVVGWGGPLDADAPKWAGSLFGFEVRIAVGLPAAPRYRPLPTQPPALRDLSLVLPAGVTAAAVAEVLRRVGGALLERLDVLDEYRGPGIPEGTRGVTWRCTLRDPARTLTEREVDAMLGRMLGALEEDLGVHRRQT